MHRQGCAAPYATYILWAPPAGHILSQSGAVEHTGSIPRSYLRVAWVGYNFGVSGWSNLYKYLLRDKNLKCLFGKVTLNEILTRATILIFPGSIHWDWGGGFKPALDVSYLRGHCIIYKALWHLYNYIYIDRSLLWTLKSWSRNVRFY